MDPTTLMTFLFKTSPTIRSVELLGSWDNFQRPYTMHHDRCRGTGFWSGCFRFEDIIFDGDRPHWTKPRSGGLKQGGTYWYYYLLDHDVEAFDGSQAQTSTCPLLPGQPMNIMDVPVEVLPPPNRHRSASLDIIGTLTSLTSIHTWDPQDKFKALNPPPISKVHGRCLSALTLEGGWENNSSHNVRSICTPYPRASSQDGRLSERACTRDRVTSTSTSACASFVGSPDLASFPCEERPDDLQIVSMLSQCVDGFRSDIELLDDVHAPTMIDADAASIGPVSVQNVQFYGSHPSSSHHPDDGIPPQWRPRLHSLSKTWYHVIGDAACDAEPAEDISPQEQQIQKSADDDDDGGNVEAWSPTFSVATVSSYGGIETPFGSGERDLPPYAHIASSASPDECHQQPPSLHVQRSPSFLPAIPFRVSPSPPRPPPPPPNQMFQSYTLPHPSMDSYQSRGKISSSTAQSPGPLLPLQNQQAELSSEQAIPPRLFALSVVMEELTLASHGSGSLTQDIFSELGFLGTSII